jgi:hypothetical protein
VQELAPEPLIRDAVHRVADDRQPDRRQMDADLVRAARLEPHVEQRVPVDQPFDFEVRDRLARRVGVERVTRRLAPVAADRRFDPPGPRARAPADERLVAPLELPGAHQLLQLLERRIAARDHEQTRGVAVEPVDDARPLLVLSARGQADEPVDQRAAGMSWGGMDDDAGRLVHDQEMFVLPGNLERHVFALEPGRRGLRNRQLELLAALEPVRLRPPLPVHDRGALLEQPLGRGARADLGQRGEEAIEPLARGLGGNGDSQRGRVSPISSATNRIATPTTMKLSARLKAGQ